MELLLQRSYENSNPNRNSTDGGPHLEIAGGPRGSPTTKEEEATNSARLDDKYQNIYILALNLHLLIS
jgi:hypothetical protein